MFRHFVAMGDSFTEGIGDAVEGLELRSAHGWVALWMQAANPTTQYTNLAERGLRASEVRSQQLQRALNLQPDFVSIVARANDCLRGPFSAERVRAELELMFGAFQSIGAQIFTSTLPDFTARLELPPDMSERIRHSLETTNAIIAALAQQHGAVFFDRWKSDLNHRAELWSQDGVHPNALGYLETARAVVPLLQARGIELEVT